MIQVTSLAPRIAPVVASFGWWFMQGGVPSVLQNSSVSTTYDSTKALQTPLNTPMTFDAIDSQSLSLPKIAVPAGIRIISYRWDFGNGLIGIGPTPSVTFFYPSVVPIYQVALSVTDSLGRTASVALGINLNATILGFGGLRVRKGTAR